MPFGKAPLDELRFERASEPDAWDDVLNVTEYGPHCVHVVALFYPLMGMSANMSEDCLTLNVFVPGSILTASYIHCLH